MYSKSHERQSLAPIYVTHSWQNSTTQNNSNKEGGSKKADLGFWRALYPVVRNPIIEGFFRCCIHPEKWRIIIFAKFKR